jgi:NADP-dependent 3-hydroxy acid dehydrogenase YdfG
MTKALHGTVALVTGASSGIGEAAARALSEQGAAVAVAARRKDRLDALAEQIGGLAIEADITDRDQAIAAVERTAQELGRLDIVINNAGVMLLGPIVDAPVEEWDRMVCFTSPTPRSRTCCVRPMTSRGEWRTLSTSARSQAVASAPAVGSTS